MSEYHLRVTEFDGSCKEAVQAILEKYTQQHYCVYEVGSVTEKPHYQAYIVLDQSKYQALRKACARIYDDRKGNEVFSISAVRKDKEVMLRYLSKGTQDTQPVVISQNMDIDPLQYNIEYWAENEEIQERKSKRQKTCNIEDMLEEALQTLQQEKVDPQDKPRILMWLRRTWRSHGKILNLYRARDYVYEMGYKLNPSESAELHQCMLLAERF